MVSGDPISLPVNRVRPDWDVNPLHRASPPECDEFPWKVAPYQAGTPSPG
jgi:hypothetical protein